MHAPTNPAGAGDRAPCGSPQRAARGSRPCVVEHVEVLRRSLGDRLRIPRPTALPRSRDSPRWWRCGSCPTDRPRAGPSRSSSASRASRRAEPELGQDLARASRRGSAITSSARTMWKRSGYLRGKQRREVLVQRPAEHVVGERERHGSLLGVGVGRPRVAHDVQEVRAAAGRRERGLRRPSAPGCSRRRPSPRPFAGRPSRRRRSRGRRPPCSRRASGPLRAHSRRNARAARRRRSRTASRGTCSRSACARAPCTPRR